MDILMLARFTGRQSPATIFIQDQAKAMVDMGHRVHIITPKPVFKDNPNFQSSDETVNCNGVYYNIPSFLSFSNIGEYSVNNVTFYYAAYKTLKRLKKQGFTPDIIHAHTFSAPSFAGLKLQEKLNIPCVITTHGSDLRLPIEHGKSCLIKNKMKKASGIISVSDKIKDSLYTIDPAIDIQVITNGYTLMNFANCEKKSNLITTCGNLVESKRFDITIKSFAEILPYHPQSKLHIIGEGILKNDLLNLVEELGIENNVSFLGYLPNDQVLWELCQSEIFALPSVDEGFGIVYLEAMSQNNLVIATKGEGFSSIVKDKKHCILVEPDSVKSLAHALFFALSGENDQQTIVEQGYSLSLKYTWEKNAVETIAFYNNCLLKFHERS